MCAGQIIQREKSFSLCVYNHKNLNGRNAGAKPLLIYFDSPLIHKAPKKAATNKKRQIFRDAHPSASVDRKRKKNVKRNKNKNKK